MKITPVSGGNPAPVVNDQPRSPDKVARAKAIAAGQEPPQPSGDAQVDKVKASINKIKMKTQVSTNRHEFQEPVAETAQEGVELNTQSIKKDTNEQVESVEETKPIDPQMAALIKAKRALQVKERELAEREEALKKQAPVNTEEFVSKADLVSNPLGVLQKHGVTYDQLTEAILNNQSSITPEILELKAELNSLKEELNGKLASRDTQAEQQVLAEIKRESLALTASEDFEAIRQARELNHPDFANGKDPVTDLIHRTWQKTGEIMDVREAAELVENQLLDELTPFAKLKKVQSRLTPQQEQQAAQTPAAPKANTRVMRTLTNRDNASPVMDRRARALAAFNGTLRKG